jgi:hypothetical protein
MNKFLLQFSNDWFFAYTEPVSRTSCTSSFPSAMSSQGKSISSDGLPSNHLTLRTRESFSLLCRMGWMLAIVPQLRSPLSEVHYPIFPSTADLLENLVIFASIQLDLAYENIGAVNRVDSPNGVTSVGMKQPSADCNDPIPLVDHQPSVQSKHSRLAMKLTDDQHHACLLTTFRSITQ